MLMAFDAFESAAACWLVCCELLLFRAKLRGIYASFLVDVFIIWLFIWDAAGFRMLGLRENYVGSIASIMILFFMS